MKTKIILLCAAVVLNLGLAAFAQSDNEEIEITVLESRSSDLETIEQDFECISGGPGSTECALKIESFECQTKCAGRTYSCCGMTGCRCKPIKHTQG